MLLPTCSVKACAKSWYQFLEEIDEQCRSLCVQKPGTDSFYILHVTRSSTLSSLGDFSWSSVKNRVEGHHFNSLIPHLSLPNFQEHWMAHKKKFRYFLLVDNFHFRLVTMTFKFPNTKVITFFFSFAVAEDRALYFEPAQKSIVSHYMRMWSCKVESGVPRFLG